MEETARAEKKAEREKKRRRVQMVRKIKVGAGLCIGLAVLLYLLSAFVFFKVESIEVIGTPDENGESLPGSSYYSSEEIVRVSGVKASDLRGGASLVLAGLAAQGTTTVDDIKYILRGYENMSGVLTSLGCDIVKEERNTTNGGDSKS